MKEYMRVVANSGGDGKKDLSVEERNLLSVAYKNVVGARRASWRVVQSIEAKEEQKGNDDHADLLRNYRHQVEAELESICAEVLSALRDVLVPGAADSESKVFYLKMEGDYCRYLAEFQAGAARKTSIDDAASAYEHAQKIAEDGLAPTNPIRLGLALNYSVFYYEIRGEQGKACTLAKDAFDAAVAKLDRLEEDSYKDATLIMQLLRDNLTLWMTDEAEDRPVENDMDVVEFDK